MTEPLVSHRMRKIPESATLKMNSIIKDLNEKGIRVINFTAGEPDGNTPDKIKNAAIEAINSNQTRYTASQGILKLRERIAKKLWEDNKIKCSASDIIVTNGGKQAIFNFFQACLEPGDEVLVPSPFWLSYPPMIRLANGVPILVKTKFEDGYKVNVDRLKEFCTDRTRAIVVNYPNNPTGASYSKNELKKIAEFALEKDLIILSDEIYEKLDYQEFVSFASLSEEIAKRTVTVNGFSKTYNMTGWRVGYCTGPSPIIKAMGVFQGHSTSNINSIAQHAAIAALDLGKEFEKTNLETYRKRRDLMCELLNGIPGIKFHKPEGAFYIFINCEEYIGRKIRNSDELAEFLLQEAHVGVVAGGAFGDDNCIRVSYPLNEEDIQEGCLRLKNAFTKLVQ